VYNKKQQKQHTYLFIRKFQIGVIVCPDNTPKPRRQGGRRPHLFPEAAVLALEASKKEADAPKKI
jgi:hypothetical protein